MQGPEAEDIVVVLCPGGDQGRVFMDPLGGQPLRQYFPFFLQEVEKEIDQSGPGKNPLGADMAVPFLEELEKAKLL